MQNKKQALILMLIFIFCWIVGYWLDNYNYYDIGIISLFIPLFIVPVLALRYMRQKKQKDLASINKIFRAF
ncbi:hypothetical protein KAJ89_02465, partial [Candidatus Parcubacteria bacterium]|nr:hypothetical protein [Candidatus Parcubacteria bacterium]